jgi:uncharacterized membrane protein
VAADPSGYVQSIDETALVAFACKHDTVLRMALDVGDFVVAGACLVTVKDDQRLSPAMLAICAARRASILIAQWSKILHSACARSSMSRCGRCRRA